MTEQMVHASALRVCVLVADLTRGALISQCTTGVEPTSVIVNPEKVKELLFLLQGQARQCAVSWSAEWTC